MCLSHTKDGQEKEDQSQQIPTFRCCELSILNICIAKKSILSPHGAMWQSLAHPVTVHCLLWVSDGASYASQTPALMGRGIYLVFQA